MESMERALAEVEALQAIYGDDFTLISQLPSTYEPSDLELCLQILHGSLVTLHCKLPMGYPDSTTAQVYVTGSHLLRSTQDDWSDRLQQRAHDLQGQEVVMELVQDLQEWLLQVDDSQQQEEEQQSTETKPSLMLGRRWIWVHHITSSERKKSIVQEARALHLGGYLKPGYPGVMVVEGESCEEFVNWVKGNKSRPGGFGRNWGHHVRGEISIEQRQLPVPFQELPESMKELGALCKDCGLEDEFREYVLQHKVANSDEPT